MTERKKPGPKPKCKECGRKEGDGHGDDCPVGLGVTVAAFNEAEAVVSPASTPLMDRVRAQAYADRVWTGQSESADRAWRIERVKEALAGQNLPFEGVTLPE